jgi:hypothetical protein
VSFLLVLELYSCSVHRKKAIGTFRELVCHSSFLAKDELWFHCLF